MPTAFDAQAIDSHGWRQGAVLGPELRRAARQHAPAGLALGEEDWFIVTSHDCDLVNERLDKEPVFEVLRALPTQHKAPDKQQAWGRNPRQLQLEATGAAGPVLLSCRVHERWTLPRELLASEAPVRHLGDKERRLIAEWLAKRYIRPAFPTAFDKRWRTKLKDWTGLLGKFSCVVQGVYLRLSTLRELDEQTPYKIHLILAAPAEARRQHEWAKKRELLGAEVEGFWKQFAPAIELVGVEVLGTDEITLADIEPYLRFDADWVSFADDSELTPAVVDMHT